jgi:hypothetical protein
MLQELVVHSCAVAHHQKLRCRSLAKVPMTLLKVVKEDYDVFNCCHKVFRNLPQNRPEPSVLDSMIVRYKVPYLDGVLVMQYQFRVPNSYDGFVRQQRHS